MLKFGRSKDRLNERHQSQAVDRTVDLMFNWFYEEINLLPKGLTYEYKAFPNRIFGLPAL